jgi:hypothetical protein
VIVSRGNPEETCRPIGSILGEHGRRVTAFCESFTDNGLAAAKGWRLACEGQDAPRKALKGQRLGLAAWSADANA